MTRFRMILLGLGGCSSMALAANPCFEFQVVPAPTVGQKENILHGVHGVSDSEVWAVGFWSPAGVPSKVWTLAMRFNGSAWTVTPTPNLDLDSQPFNLLSGVAAAAPDDVVAVGAYTPAGGTSQALSMHWDGAAWSTMSSPAANGGSTLTSATSLPTGSIIACGALASPDPVILSTGLLAWRSGNGWTTSTAPAVGVINEFNGLSALSDDTVWCVGAWGNSFGDFRILIQRYQSGAWTSFDVPTPGVADSLEEVVALSPTDVWAVGYWRRDAAPFTEPLIMHYDGNAWTQVALPAFPDGPAELRAITARGPGDLYAMGTYATSSGVPRSLIMHFDGQTWSVLPFLTTDGVGEWLRGATTLPSGRVWGVGQVSIPFGPTAPLTVLGQPQGPIGDVDGDGAVGQADLNVLLASFGLPADPGTPADLNGDGLIDQLDLNILLAHFGEACN